MRYVQRREPVLAMRYDGTRDGVELIAAAIPGLLCRGEQISALLPDEPPSENPKIVAAYVGDWILDTKPSPTIMPGRIFRALFEEDLPKAGPHAPGAAARRRAGALASKAARAKKIAEARERAAKKPPAMPTSSAAPAAGSSGRGPVSTTTKAKSKGGK